jgi:hypothetical protein
MTAIADLSPCTYLSDSPQVLAVGWLGRSESYQHGPVDEGVFAKLIELLVDPWQRIYFMGRHECEFCRFTGCASNVSYRNQSVTVGVANVFVPGEGVLFAAPSMIVHYIDSHEYAPPQVFQDAVLACPPMRSMEYLQGLLRNGPKGFAARKG